MEAELLGKHSGSAAGHLRQEREAVGPLSDWMAVAAAVRADRRRDRMSSDLVHKFLPQADSHLETRMDWPRSLVWSCIAEKYSKHRAYQTVREPLVVVMTALALAE